MSAHEDAIVAAADAAAYPLTLVQRPDVEERVRRYVNTYLAALPPSIVVDGKVVGLGAANRRMLERGTYDDVYTIEDLLDAAREVEK